MSIRNGVQSKINVAKLQVQVEHLVEDVKEIRENHLVHLFDKVESLERKMSYYAGGLAVGIFLLEIFLRFLK